MALYEEKQCIRLKPDTFRLVSLLQAWRYTSDPSTTDTLEKYLYDALHMGGHSKWNSQAIVEMMWIYSRGSSPDCVHRCKRLVAHAETVGAHLQPTVYWALQDFCLRSTRGYMYEVSLALLHKAIDLENPATNHITPIKQYYNVMIASGRHNRASAERTMQFFLKMETPRAQGGYGLEIDKVAYAILCRTIYECDDIEYCKYITEFILKRVDDQLKASKDPTVQNDAHWTVNGVLDSLMLSSIPGALNMAFQIIERLQEYSNNGYTLMEPKGQTWNPILRGVSLRRQFGGPEKAEQLLHILIDRNRNNKKKGRPTMINFMTVVHGYFAESDGLDRADALVKEMEQLYESGYLASPPRSKLYATLCWMWVERNPTVAIQRIPEVLSHVIPRFRLNPRKMSLCKIYDAYIAAFCKVDQLSKAEEVVVQMLERAAAGDQRESPSDFALASVIGGYFLKGQYSRALSLFNKAVAMSNEVTKIKPILQVLQPLDRQLSPLPIPGYKGSDTRNLWL